MAHVRLYHVIRNACLDVPQISQEHCILKRKPQTYSGIFGLRETCKDNKGKMLKRAKTGTTLLIYFVELC